MNKDHILHLPGFLDPVCCQHIIDLFESLNEYHQEGTVGDNLIIHDAKKCTEMTFKLCGDFKIHPVPHHHVEQEHVQLPSTEMGWKKFKVPFYTVPDFINYLVNGFRKYAQEYPFLDQLPQTNICDGIKIQKYNPDECYSALHCETMGGDLDRVLAWMIYLNNVTDGGETEFPSQDKKFQPRCGDLLIWPAGFTHPHRGIVSKTQVKYIVTGWTVYANSPSK